jgi:DNA-binding transcriptional ArsR family regulator
MPPTLENDFILRPRATRIAVGLEPAQNMVSSLLMLNMVEHFSGLGEWVNQTATRLAPDVLHRNKVVLEGLFHAVQPDRRWPSFTAYLDDLAARDPATLRDRLLWHIVRPHTPATLAGAPQVQLVEPSTLLGSADAYISFLQQHFYEIDVPIELEAHALLNDPPAMLDLIMRHMRAMWQEHLSAEWERVKPILHESVGAFGRIDFSRMTGAEAMRVVTGQEQHEKWDQLIALAEEIIFVPSAHLGPYLRKCSEGRVLWIVFGARLPEGAQAGASALGRSDLLVRLGALNDDTRLRILALLAQHDELCAQDIITELDLTQSATSRHLRQLSATGYVTERRREIAKCYTLNRERIGDTFQALEQFLSRP